MSSTPRPLGPRRDRPATRHHVRPPAPLLAAPGTELTPRHVDGLLTVVAGLDTGSLVAVYPDRPGHMTLGVRELPSDPRCAGAGLFGLDVPSGCSLLAASFAGVADGNDSDPDRADATRVDALVTALGDVHARVHHHDGTPRPVLGTPGGVVVDALHRAMRLPAPGSPPPLTELVARMWLHRVLGLASPKPTWADAAAAHLEAGRDRPNRGGGAAVGGPAVDPTVDAVVASIGELADEADWHDLHHAAAIGRMAAPELDPWEARWMDHTMFARWMVDSFRSTDLALAVLRTRGAVGAADRIEEVLDRIRTPATVARHRRRGA